MGQKKAIDTILDAVVTDQVSDVHFKVGTPPLIRRSGAIMRAQGFPSFTTEHLVQITDELTNEAQREQLNSGSEVDLAYSLAGKARFRVNIFYQRGTPAIVMRKIPFEIPVLSDLGLPDSVKQICSEQRGLILVTGATGSGKSTTLAAMINEINENRQVHIVTIEDPIEFLHPDKNCSVCQREVGIDTVSWPSALHAVFRQDPDVILIGEMRDAETAMIALSGAETGHLVMSTLHTTDAPETINRIIDMFPAFQQKQIRIQLGGLLKAVISQRLLPAADGKGRVLATEVMVHTATIGNCIADPEKSYLIPETMEQGGSQYGMQTFDMSLLDLLQKGKIDEETALAAATNPNSLVLRIKGVESADDWRME
ncbi:MAG: type IV pilus twitching motility protein PilT [Candidatus Fermentibacteraceae bacterium]|nr:type IV pilus twitching motility protein PilT [Candidatus Fermentibacteraceae bacterium]